MSFSEDVRHELVERPPAKSCCRLAFLSGLIRHAGSLQVRSGGELAAVAELADPAAARLAFTLLRERGADCEILSFREHRFQRRNRVLLRIAGGTSIQLLHEAGVLSEALTPLERPPRRLLNRACCRGAYLRGALVAAGSVSAPRQPAHLEVRTAELEAAEALAEVAAAEEIPMRTASRRGHAIAYLKSRDAIRDLLALVGAHDAVLSLQEAEVISATRRGRQSADQLRPRQPGPGECRRPPPERGDRPARPGAARPSAASRGRAENGQSIQFPGRIGRARAPADDQVRGRPSHENSHFPYKNLKYPPSGCYPKNGVQRS